MCPCFLSNQWHSQPEVNTILFKIGKWEKVIGSMHFKLCCMMQDSASEQYSSKQKVYENSMLFILLGM